MWITLALTSLSWAQDAITLDAVRKAVVGQGSPSLTVHAQVTGEVQAELACGNKKYSLVTAVSPGSSHPIRLEGLPLGESRCQGTLVLRDEGGEGELPLSLQVEMLAPLELVANNLSLQLQQVTISASRPLSRVSVEAYGEGSALLGQGELGVLGEREVTLEWGPASPAEVLKLKITGKDLDQFASQLELSPWSYAIPHQDVVFSSGSADLISSELPKLEAAYSEVVRVLARYGEVVAVKLFVAGYTDTVGPADANHALSGRRALALAEWFRARGFTGEIGWQGFGEGALAVATPDETENPQNRRAIYLLAASEPTPTSEIPARAWKALR